MSSRIAVLTILFHLVIFFGNAQSLNNSKSNIEIPKTIGNIKKATGWIYNHKENSWADHPNFICRNLKADKKTPSDDKITKSKSSQNFDSISLQTITYKNHVYYLLIIECLEGEYTYPTLKKDWSYQPETKVYIFDETDINDLRSLSNYLCVTTGNKIVVTKKAKDNGDLITNIKRELIRFPSTSSKKYTFVLRRPDNDSVHFLLPQYYSKDPIEIIQNRYFEISLKDYYKFLGLKEDKNLY